MVGDFNARTSNKPDFVDNSGNKYLNIGQLNNTIEISQRNNFDGEVNKHENKLIDFCRSTNLKIVNGRKSSDSLGRFTHFSNNNGASTVDYRLSDDKIFPLIKNFTVQKQTFLSDHCQIALWLETNEVISQTNAKSTYVWTKLLPGFKWNKNSETKFRQVLNTPKFCSIIEKFNKTEFAHDYKGVENASDKLSSILLEAAKTSCKYKSDLPKNRNL